MQEYTLSTVIKITPKGSIKIDDGNLFKNGCHNYSAWNYDYLEPYTPELEAKLKSERHYNHMCSKITGIESRKLSKDKVQRIYDILREESETT